MAIDKTRQQRRARSVINHLRALGRGLNQTNPQDRPDVIDQDLAARPQGLAIKHRPRPEDAHASIVVPQSGRAPPTETQTLRPLAAKRRTSR